MADPDLGKIKRNAKRMADQGAPEAEIDDYVKTEGATFEQLTAFKGFGKGPSPETMKDADFAEKMGSGGMGLRLADNLSLGAFTPVSSAIGAAGKTAFKAVTGQPTDFVGDYTRERDTQDELLRRSRDGGGIPGYAAELALSLPFMGGKAAAGAVVDGVAAAAPAARSTFQRFVTDPAKTGAAYGGIYGANSARGGVGEHVEAAGTGAATGAVLGPAMHGAVSALGQIPGAMNQAWRAVTGRSPSAVAENASRAAEMQAAGVTPFGPAITDRSVGGFASRGLANSMVGGRMRGAAERTITDIEDATQAALSRHAEGRPVNDMGADLKDTLRYNLAERSKSRDTLERMPPDELAGITGPIDERGFSPPPPRVSPIPPRPVAPARPEPVDPYQIQFETVAPRAVKRGEVTPNYPKHEDIQPPARVVQEAEALQREYATASAEQQTALRRYREVVDRASRETGRDPVEITTWMETPVGRNGWGRPLNEAYEAAIAAGQAEKTARQRLEVGQRAVSLYQDKAWRDAVRDAHVRAEHDVESAFMREQQAATREAQEATQAQRAAAIRAEEVKRAEAAAEQTARARAEAEAEAMAATQRAQAKAQAEHEATRGTRPGFETGRSRETYPTEFDAAYLQLNRETPAFQRNPLGGRGMSGSPTPTATEGLLQEFALRARASGQLKGYKDRSVFGETGVPRPDFLAVVEKDLGRDVSDRIQAFMLQRTKGQPSGGPQALRDLITAVRRAKQDAQRVGSSPLHPGQPMPERAANLARLEGVLKDDYHRFMRETGPGGERLSGMVRNVDQQYGQHLDDLRKPLAKVFGDKVEPMQAMDRLLKAANDGDLTLLRPFMRVMNEKAGRSGGQPDPMKGAAAILTHATGGARTMDDFLKGYRGLSKEALDVLLPSDAGKSLRTQLDKLASLAETMQPYARAINRANQGGVRVEHLPAVGAIAMGHVLPLIAVYGGASATSRFLSSPRYVRWLTEAARTRSPAELEKHVAKLAFMTARDTETGADIRKAASRMLGATLGIKPANAMFIGEGAAADDPALVEAKQAYADGKAPDAIWKQHGWWMAPDGKWRSEVPDDRSELVPEGENLLKRRGTVRLEHVLNHPALFERYPDLKEIPVAIIRKVPGFAQYKTADGRIELSPRAFGNSQQLKGLILHEVQHAIGQREGFAYGRPGEAMGPDLYSRPGEIEAFNTQFNRDMTGADRRASPPWSRRIWSKPGSHVRDPEWGGAVPLAPRAASGDRQ